MFSMFSDREIRVLYVDHSKVTEQTQRLVEGKAQPVGLHSVP